MLIQQQRPHRRIIALVAQQEREAISRPREVLAVAKSLGVRLGNPNGIEAIRRAGKRTVRRSGQRSEDNRRAARAGPDAGDRGRRGEGRNEPQNDRGGAERTQHADHPEVLP